MIWHFFDSFPGGKEDDDDDHITETALREAEEEVGLDRNLVQVWGALSPVPTRVKSRNLLAFFFKHQELFPT